MTPMEALAALFKRKKALVAFLDTIGVDEVSLDTLLVRIFARRQLCINAGILMELDQTLRDAFPDDQRTKLLNYINRFEHISDMRSAIELGIHLMELKIPEEPILEFTRWYYIFALSVNARHAKRKDADAAKAIAFAKQLDEPSRSEALGAVAFYQARSFGHLNDPAMTLSTYIEAGTRYLSAYEQLVAAHADCDFCLSIAQMIVNLRAWWGKYCGMETIHQCPISEEFYQQLIQTYGLDVLALSATE